ncbi:hypothetical protein ACAG25_12655 [Mycobacterium sp. pV006]|uniref:hypothetical protein n=1 Tax=Mycobacterium sp. pV006 TaxID=3238983 RepID=UPI00351BE870
MTITPDDLRRLLDAGPDATLVLIEGRTKILTAGDLDRDENRGALEIISRAALVERTGATDMVSESELSTQARALETAVTELGG